MRRAAFVAQRRPVWRRFETLLSRADAPLGRFSADDIADFSQHLRGLCHDLATIRSRGWGRDLERYVNGLVVRGHGLFYAAPATRWRTAADFLRAGFPCLLRAHAAYVGVAAALLVVPALVSGALVAADASRAAHVLPGTQLEQLEQMYAQPQDGPSVAAGMAGFYVWNNAGLAFRCFATGIFFGAGTVYYLVYNGIFLGTVTGYLLARGHAQNFFTFVVGHGSFELTAVVVAGAAGLLVGHAALHPAPYTWGESLRRRGRAGAQLALGAAAMLLLAAALEAGWSPLALPPAVKFTAGALLWLLVFAYLVFAGRRAGTGAGA